MFIDIDFANEEHLHNLINLHLFPERILRLGQADNYRFRDADVVVERVGNLFASGRDAISYRYCIDGAGFNLCLLAVWQGDDEATASVRVISIGPNDDAVGVAHTSVSDAPSEGAAPREEATVSTACGALHDWLTEVVDARMPPRDMFANLRLM